MTALVMAAADRLRLPRVSALPHVAAATVRRLLMGACLANGVGVLVGPGWALLVAGALLGWPRLL